jgi:hypothetical protein
MSSLNPLSFNAWVQGVGVMAVAQTQTTAGVSGFVDAPLQQVLPQILSYAEGRIQRDIDAFQASAVNRYTLTVGNNQLNIPIGDFLIIETLELLQTSNGVVVNSIPMTPVSKEFIQNCYSGVFSSGDPQVLCDGTPIHLATAQRQHQRILLGPTPNYAYPVNVLRRHTHAVTVSICELRGSADTSYTYISQWLPDLLLMASMIFISAYQRNFSANSDSIRICR